MIDDDTQEMMMTTQIQTPLADAYCSAAAECERLESAYYSCECAVCASSGPASDCSAYRAYSGAYDRVEAARRAWLDSDEPREYRFGGDSYPGGDDEARHWHAPSEVEAALQEWTEGGDWDVSDGPVHVRDWARPIDPVTREDLGVEARSYHMFPAAEPDCEGVGVEHDWQSPHDVVGGIEENPGVQGHGGGVVIREVCAHCGAYRITDTWAQGAQDPCTGEQGLTEVTYQDADDCSLAWIQRHDAERGGL